METTNSKYLVKFIYSEYWCFCSQSKMPEEIQWKIMTGKDLDLDEYYYQTEGYYLSPRQIFVYYFV